METKNNQNEESQPRKRKLRANTISVDEIAELLGVSRSTAQRHLKTVPDLGERLGHLYNGIQKNKIFKHFGITVIAWGLYYKALLAGMLVVLIYKMDTHAQMLIRSLFHHFWPRAKGSKRMSAFHICLAVMQITLTVGAFLLAGYLVGRPIFSKKIVGVIFETISG
jgi:hypothetical protein